MWARRSCRNRKIAPPGCLSCERPSLGLQHTAPSYYPSHYRNHGITLLIASSLSIPRLLAYTAVPATERPTLSWADPEWGRDPVVTDGPAPHPPWRSMVSALLAATSVVCLLLGNVALWVRQDLYSTRAADQQARQIMRSSNVQAWTMAA